MSVYLMASFMLFTYSPTTGALFLPFAAMSLTMAEPTMTPSAKDAMAESVAVPDTAGMTPSQAYKAAQDAMDGIDRHHGTQAGSDEEVDYDPNKRRPGCDRKCKLCYRTHCRWRNTNYED